MNNIGVPEILSRYIVGGNLASIKVAGNELVIYFSSNVQYGIKQFYVDTDAWVFVNEDDINVDYAEIVDANFFLYRSNVLAKLFGLTGHDISSASIVNKTDLRISLNRYTITICPRCNKVRELVHCDTWHLIAQDVSDDEHWLLKVESDVLELNKNSPLAHYSSR